MPLDAISTIFIFMIGLPAILLQTLPAEVRAIVLQKRRQQVAAFTLGPILSGLALVAIGVFISRAWQADGLTQAHRVETLWLVLLAILMFLSLAAALLFSERWSRTSVIEHLYRDATRGIARRGRPEEEIVNTLADLGIQSKPGQDKGLIIHAFARLVRDTQAKESYDGAQLEHVIKGLQDVIAAGEYSGSANNFLACGDLLLALIMDASGRAHQDDLEAAVEAASLLGRASLEHEESHIQLKFLDALVWADEAGDAESATQALLRIGSHALESDNVLIANAALDKLETVVSNHSPVKGELAEDFIGLLSHFWARDEAGRQYSLEYLVRADDYFVDPLPEVISKARRRALNKARFRAYNYLTRMLEDIEPM